MAGPTIGVLAPLTGGFYCGTLLSGIAEAVQAADGQVLAIQTVDAGQAHPDYTAPPRLQIPLAWERVAGWIVIVSALELADLRRLKATRKPLVLISEQVPELECPAVLPDNRSGVREAVAHLVEHGHRRIAFAGSLGQHDIRERYAAYCEALTAHGLRVDPRLIYVVDDNVESGGIAAAQRMLADGLPSSAVIAGTDYNAIGIMQTLSAAGYVLPRDQAIIGFDDIAQAAYLSPALSSVRQRFDLLGRRAAECLLSMLAGAALPPEPIYVPTTFVARESCGCYLQPPAASDAQPPTPAELPQRVVALFGARAADDRRLQALADQVAQVVAAAADGCLPDDDQLQRLGTQLVAVAPHMGIAEDLFWLLRDVCAGWQHATARFREAFLFRMAFGLVRGFVQRQFADLNYFQALLQSQYQISMDLIQPHRSQAELLGWLRWTRARAGVLAVWQDADAERSLRVAATYGLEQTVVLDTRYSPAQFPPAQLSALAAADEATLLIPVKVQTSDWGWLAVVAPIENRFATGRETFNQWAALLSLVLDHQAMIDALRSQQEQLAQAYRREHELAETLRISEERYALAARAANDGLWDWDRLNDTIYYSSRCAALLGYPEAEVAASPELWLSRVDPEDRPRLELALDDHCAGRTPTLECEHRIVLNDQQRRWVLCRGLAVRQGERCVRLVGSLTDITERKRLEEQLRRDALYDALTGLPNRRLFIERLQYLIDYRRHHPDCLFAVLFLDLDDFKAINDQFGHLFGDRLLVAVADRLKQSLRASDTAARFGGDEFAALLTDLRDVQAAPRIAERVLHDIAQPFTLLGQMLTVTASLGVATATERYTSAEAMLADADAAMYRAKAAGKARVVLLDDLLADAPDAAVAS